MDNPEYCENKKVEPADGEHAIIDNYIYRDENPENICNCRPNERNKAKFVILRFLKKIADATSFKGDWTFFAVIDAVSACTCKQYKIRYAPAK
jgi:hypothetical protein